VQTLFFFILVAYLAVEAAEHLLHLLNLKYLAKHGAEVPPGFTPYIDGETLAQMRDYALAHGRLQRVESLVSAAVTLLFLFGGLLNRVNTLIAAQDWSPVVSGVVFFLALIYADTLIKLPFSLYTTFSLEKRFGFSTMTPALFVQDTVKSLLIGTLLLGVLLAVLLSLITALPGLWWLAGWLFVLLYAIFLLYLSPALIAPLFNRFSPIADTSLEGRIKEIMARAGLTVNRVFSMDGSKRSKHSNAYFTGIGRLKKIVLFDTLLASHEDDEILAILAHEAGHWKKKHILKMLAVSQLLSLLGFYAAHRLTEGNFLARLFMLDIPSIHAQLLLAVFVGSLVLFPLKPLLALISRRHEIEADDFAVQLTDMPGAMARGLMKLGRDNLANLHPHPWYTAIYYSHPPLAQRVQRLLSVQGDASG
jgi:STE24 endopeptidase